MSNQQQTRQDVINRLLISTIIFLLGFHLEGRKAATAAKLGNELREYLD